MTTKLDAALNKECLRVHNVYRKNHEAEDLVYNEALAIGAQKWADHIAEIATMEHSPESDGKVGENIATHTNPDMDFNFTAQMAVDSWYSEILDYDFEGENQLECGHFTQVVWKATKEAGFGRSCTPRGMRFIVGQYLPPANWKNQWKKNVVRPLDGVMPKRPEKKEEKPEDAAPAEDPNALKKVIGGKHPDDELITVGKKIKTIKGKKITFIVETYKKPDGTEYVVEGEDPKAGTPKPSTSSVSDVPPTPTSPTAPS